MPCLFLHGDPLVSAVPTQSLKNGVSPFHVQASERIISEIRQILKSNKNQIQIKSLTLKSFPLIFILPQQI